MSTYKTISTKSMIAKVYRDFKPSNANWTYDAIDWIGEAIQFVGYHCGLETKTTEHCDSIQVKHHRACFPCDMETLIGVIYKGRRLPLGADVSKGLMNKNHNGVNDNGGFIKANDSDLLKLNLLTAALTALESQPSNPTVDQEILDTLHQINLITPLLISTTSRLGDCGLDYYCVNPDYIITSFCEGEIDLIYMAFPTDDDGFPKILDEPYYKDAVKWYIISQMLLGGYKHPEFTWKEANQYWELNRNRAANKQKIPSLDDLQKFTNMWTNMKFDRRLAERFFVNGEAFRQDLVDFRPNY